MILRHEAAAQRAKAAELRRRATWWRPLTRALMLLDAEALEVGAEELERLAAFSVNKENPTDVE